MHLSGAIKCTILKINFRFFHHSNSAIFDDVKYVPTYIPTNHSDSKISIQIIENDIPRVNYIIRLNGKGQKKTICPTLVPISGIVLDGKKNFQQNTPNFAIPILQSICENSKLLFAFFKSPKSCSFHVTLFNPLKNSLIMSKLISLKNKVA